MQLFLEIRTHLSHKTESLNLQNFECSCRPLELNAHPSLGAALAQHLRSCTRPLALARLAQIHRLASGSGMGCGRKSFKVPAAHTDAISSGEGQDRHETATAAPISGEATNLATSEAKRPLLPPGGNRR